MNIIPAKAGTWPFVRVELEPGLRRDDRVEYDGRGQDQVDTLSWE